MLCVHACKLSIAAGFPPRSLTKHHQNHNSKAGLADNIETYGLISGLWTSTFALGAFIGPSVSGALYDSIGFRQSTMFVIGVHLVVALIIALFMICDRTPNSYKQLPDSETLLRSRDPLFYGNGSVDKV